MEATVRDVILDHPEFTLDMINRDLRAHMPQAPHVGRTTLRRMLNKQLITTKTLEDSPAERNTDTTKASRRDYANWLMTNIDNKIVVYIDEAGINLWTKRTRGRAPRGQRAVRVLNGRRGGNLTMCLAVSPETGLVSYDLMDHGMNRESFSQFLQTTAAGLHPHPDRGIVFIFDNAPAHRQAAQVQLPAGFSVMYLPPYSPFLNICENAFSIWKWDIKNQLAAIRPQLLLQDHQQSMASLATLATQGLGVITAEKMTAAFRGMHAYLPACISQEDILM